MQGTRVWRSGSASASQAGSHGFESRHPLTTQDIVLEGHYPTMGSGSFSLPQRRHHPAMNGQPLSGPGKESVKDERAKVEGTEGRERVHEAKDE